MASNNLDNDWNFYKRVINKNWSRFINDLEATKTLDTFRDTGYCDYVTSRDISELPRTSDKVRKILDVVSKKGPKGYNDFKECLKKSGQEHLAALLESSEKELIKKQREEAAKKEAENADRLAKARRLITKKSGDTKKTSPGDDSRHSPVVPKPKGKKEVIVMQGSAQQKVSDGAITDMGKATESDLIWIADDAVGENWELIAPFLDVDRNTLERIKADNPTSMSQQIFKMLIAWSRRLGSKATLNKLESSMREAPSSVTIKWKVFDDLRKQRPSEMRSSEPVSATTHNNSYQGMTTDVTQRMTDLSVSDNLGELGKTRRQGEEFSHGSYQNTGSSIPQNVNLSQLQTNDVNDSGEDTARADERRGKDGNDEPDAQRLNSSNLSLLPANVIVKPAHSNKPEDKSPVENPDNIDDSDNPKCFEGQNDEKGRLKILHEKDIKCLQCFCCEEIGFGGFGEVYKSKGKLSGIDIYVVLKKIKVKENEDEKMKSVTNEKLASRTMHFAIVPLLAHGADDIKASEKVYYFISPYMENGNLSNAIQNHNKSQPVLELPLRMKIMYHIASAIHFLHTPVNKFRGTILHMDIKSLNIVLDQWYNARLIDFGLAREMAEGRDSETATNTPLPHTKGYYPTITHKQLTVYADYYSFGVVIRELLTGMEPFVRGETELRTLSSRKTRSKLMTLWKDDKNKPYPVAEQLLKLSTECLDLKNKNIDSEKIVINILELMNEKLLSTWDHNDGKGKKCDMCMRYNAVDDTILEHNKNCNMRVCVSCMRHSYCNPILCHTCGKEIIPSIGYGWDAVLIAGNHVDENPELAEMFSKDVEEVKKVITSKCPLVMGISNERVLTIKPEDPGKSKCMTDQLKLDLSDYHVRKRDTLLLYFSGHYLQKKGFQLGNENDFISMEELQKLLLGTTKKADSHVRLVIFLDCCCAPGVQVDDFEDSITIVQMNACPANDQAFSDVSKGSLFRIFFTQALTRKALSAKCINDNCKDCFIDNDFVTLDNLQTYIENHYKEYPRELSKPRAYIHNAVRNDKRIGYVVNFCVDLEFIFHLKDTETQKKDFPHSTFSNIEELRTVLFDEYIQMRLPGSIGQGRQFSNTCFRDTLIIFKKNGTKAIQLDTIEEVNMAWDSRRQLHVSLRDATNVGTGLVGAFFDETSVKIVVDYLFQKGTKKVSDKNEEKSTVEFTTLLEDFSTFVSEHKQLKDVETVVDDLIEAKDTLGQMVTNLGVKFPYDESADESANPKNWANFLCFYLQVDSQTEKMQ